MRFKDCGYSSGFACPHTEAYLLIGDDALKAVKSYDLKVKMKVNSQLSNSKL